MKSMNSREKLFVSFLCSGIVFAGSLLFVESVYALTQPVYTIAVNPPVIYRGDTVFITVTPTNFNASSTVFEWHKNGVLDSANSGAGKSDYSFAANAPQTFGVAFVTVKLTVKPGGDFADVKQTIPLSIVTLPEGATPGAGGVPAPSGSGNLPTIETRSIELLALPSNNPDPGETVTVSVRSSDIDLDRASYRWTVNGAAPKNAQQGAGAKSYSFIAGKTGTNYSVAVTITPPTGAALSKNTVVRSFDMPVYWWADSIVPAWYRGKALPSIGSEVKIAALPNLPGVNQKTLLYSWEFNNNFVGNQSGVGKNIFRFTPQFAGVRETTKVRAQNASGSADKEVIIEIAPFEPLVRAYELRPLEGIHFVRSLTLAAVQREILFDAIAEPFFFPLRNLRDLAFQWSSGGNEAQKQEENPNVLSVQSGPNAQGIFPISILAKNKKDDGQQARHSFEIEFR